MSKLFDLRPYQQTAMDMLKTSIAVNKSKSPVLHLPTGGGKTVIAAHIVEGALKKGSRLAFVVPYISLINQTIERFIENGIPASKIGVMQADHPWTNQDAEIQVCSKQTLERREIPDVDVVVIDECHIRGNIINKWISGEVKAEPRDIMREPKTPIFIGLSATPWAKNMGKFYDDLLQPFSLGNLIKQGYLSKFRVFAPVTPDLSGVGTRMGDYKESELAEAVDTPKLNGDVVREWLGRAKDLPTLCFAVNRQHARSIHDQFLKCGIAAAYVDANTPVEEREQLGRDLKSGEIKVAVSIGTLIAGIDWDIRCILFARPTQSEQLYVQAFGRGLRTAGGKEHLIFIDFSGTVQKLGFPTDISFDELDDGTGKQGGNSKERDKVNPTILCPECTSVIPVGERICEACGHELPVKLIEHGEAMLAEINENLEQVGKETISVIQVLREKGKQQIYSELFCLCRDRNYSSGWLSHKYREIFGVWPRKMKDISQQPSPELLSWIRSKQIAYAKCRKNAA